MELPKIEWIDVIRFNNAIEDEDKGYPGISAKDIEVYVSTTDTTSGFKKVLGVTLKSNKNNQVMKITPTQAKWVKFVITSNYGNSEYTELGLIGVFDDKVRTKDLATEFKEKGFINLYGIYFDFASANLKPESKAAIDQILAFLQANPSQNITIEGHTDNVGNEKSNMQLSIARAERVKTELVKRGINPQRLTSKGLGASQPIANNTTDTGRAQNRRVTMRGEKK